MPVIDVHLPAGLVPADRHPALATSLAAAVLEAEHRPVVEPYASNTAAFVHELPAVSTVAEGGWGVAGQALGEAEFAAPAAAAG